MTSSEHSEYHSDRLRSEILLLSAYFSNQQSRSSESHSDDNDWPLCADISTLLTIGNNSSPEAKLVNAVAGKINNYATEHLICVENAFQHYGQVQAFKSGLKHGWGGKMDDRVDGAGRNPLVRSDSKRCQTVYTDRAQISERGPPKCQEVAYLCSITTIKQEGQKLLTQWDEERQDEEIAKIKKYVSHRSFLHIFLIIGALSNFTFHEHLGDLFNVISSLDSQRPQQLMNFNLFIHHRAFRKLGWRVREFSSHWGDSPLQILSAHLRLDFEPRKFQFPHLQGAEFETLIENYRIKVTGRSSPAEYCVNPENAPEWIATLKSVWGILEDKLLIIDRELKSPVTKNTPVRTTSPDAETVEIIVSIMFSLEALMPVFKHLLTVGGAAQPLADAGELNSVFRSIYEPLLFFRE